MYCSWICIFFLYTCICLDSAFSSSSSSSTVLSYTQHCSSIVPESSTTIPNIQISAPRLTTTYFTGGDKILAKKPGNQTHDYLRKSLTLRLIPDYYETLATDVYKVRGFLYIRFPYTNDDDAQKDEVARSNSRHGWRRQRGLITFSVSGFWSEISRKLCMVGSASWEVEDSTINLDAVLKLNYDTKENPTIYTSVISGSLESISSANDSGYFDPISIFSFSALPNYNYSLVSNEVGVISSDFDVPRNQSLRLEPYRFCSVIAWRSTIMELEYAMECKEHHHCSPLGNFESIGSSLPLFLHLNPIECSDNERKLRYTATFQNTSYDDRSFSINSTVIGEALWDDKNNILFGIACRLIDPLSHFGNAVGDCTMRLTLRYPSILTIRNEARVVGQFWSSKAIEDSGFFIKIGITTSDDNGDIIFPVRGYEYTKLDDAKKACPVKKPVKKGNTYPDGQSYNMRFDMSVKNVKGKQVAQGYTTPLCVGNDLHQGYSMTVAFAPESASDIAAVSEPKKLSNASPMNISYKIFIYPSNQFNSTWFPSLSLSMNLYNQVEITAEGVYNGETGYLCMVGCRKLVQKSIVSRDCEILVKFEYAPLNAKRGGHTTGTIQSTRPKRDPLYFDDLIIQSAAYYVEEAKSSIWRMDLEITMVLISNTVGCIFVGLQILHVKRNPEVPSSISIIMLIILSVGHMIPLVLNSEVVFPGNQSTEMLEISIGGRIEANEVTVRVITVAAFLLQIRLLQLVWTDKQSDGNEKWWFGEIMVGFVSLVLYISGCLLASLLNRSDSVQLEHSLRGDLRSYSGLILGGFLLPQILLNLFKGGSANKALSPLFYIGISMVRLVPHAYNQYRTHNYPTYGVKETYYYANPAADFCSSDIIISCEIIVFAIVVFLQQRYGGRCILPRRLRGLVLYEKVPPVYIE